AEHVPVRRQDVVDRLLAQPLQRLHVGMHVAVGRADHHGRAVHDVLARAQQPVFLEQQADMVRLVPWRMQYAQGGVADLDAVAVLEYLFGLEGPDIAYRFGGGATHDRAAGERLEWRRARRVVRVRMGADDV